MAEAFGLAAGVLQVASFGAEVGSALWTCAKKIRHADKELRDLAGQVEATSRCLRGVGSLLEDPDTKALHTSKLYDDTRAVSKGCHEVFLELARAVKKIDNGKSKISVVQRLQWPLNSDKLTEPLKILKNYNDVLHLMLTVLQIVEGRRAATSEELLVLGKSLQRLTISNESLSQSNKTLTDILTSQNQATPKSNPDFADSSAATSALPPNGPMTGPFMSFSYISDLPPLPSPPLPPPEDHSTRSDATQDHLRRCMDSVQELANTIACAMSAWQGGEKTGSSDIHGSHAKVLAELGKLSHELQCQKCSGRVSWADFDLTKAATASLGSCVCSGQTVSSHWIPYDVSDASISDSKDDHASIPGTQRPTRDPVTYPPDRNSVGGRVSAYKGINKRPKEQFPSDNEDNRTYASIGNPSRRERSTTREVPRLDEFTRQVQRRNFTCDDDRSARPNACRRRTWSEVGHNGCKTDEQHAEQHAAMDHFIVDAHDRSPISHTEPELASKPAVSEPEASEPRKLPPIIPSKSSALRERIAAFNHPLQPQGQKSETCDSTESPFIPPPPRSSAYVLPDIKHVPQQTYRRGSENDFGAEAGCEPPREAVEHTAVDYLPALTYSARQPASHSREIATISTADRPSNQPTISARRGSIMPGRYPGEGLAFESSSESSESESDDDTQKRHHELLRRHELERERVRQQLEDRRLADRTARPPPPREWERERERPRRPTLTHIQTTPIQSKHRSREAPRRALYSELDMLSSEYVDSNCTPRPSASKRLTYLNSREMRKPSIPHYKLSGRDRSSSHSYSLALAPQYVVEDANGHKQYYNTREEAMYKASRLNQQKEDEDSSVDQETRQLDLAQRIAELETVMAKANEFGTSGDEFEAEASALHPVDLLLNAGADCSVSISDSEIDNDADSDGSLYLQQEKIPSPDLGAQNNAVKPSSAVQALLSRWLGDNANTVYVAKQN